MNLQLQRLIYILDQPIQGYKPNKKYVFYQITRLLTKRKNQFTVQNEIIHFINQVLLKYVKNQVNYSSEIAYCIRKLSQLKLLIPQVIDTFRKNLKTQMAKCQSHFGQNQIVEPSAFQQTSNMSCLGCTRFITKNFSLYSSKEIYQKLPFFILKFKQQFKQEQLISKICALANEGGGLIFLAQQYQKNSIHKGMKLLKNGQQTGIKKRLQKILQCIKNKEHIQLIIQSVFLKNKPITEQNQSKSQFLLRIHVCINPQKPKYLLFYEEKTTKYKNSMRCKTFRVDLQSIAQQNFVNPSIKQIQQNYNQIFKLANKQFEKQKYLACGCNKNFKNEITINIENFLISNSNQQFTFSSEQAEICQNICNICLDNYFEQYFPPINDKWSVVFLQINQTVSREKIALTLKRVFDNSKTQFKRFYPMPKLQQDLAKYRKEKNNNVAYFLQYYVFDGKFKKFLAESQAQLNKQKLMQFVVIDQIASNFQLGQHMRKRQIDLFQKVVQHYFNFQPIIQGTPLATQTYHNKNKIQETLKNVTLKVQKQKLNVAVFAFIILFLCKKRPKSIS